MSVEAAEPGLFACSSGSGSGAHSGATHHQYSELAPPYPGSKNPLVQAVQSSCDSGINTAATIVTEATSKYISPQGNSLNQSVEANTGEQLENKPQNIFSIKYDRFTDIA